MRNPITFALLTALAAGSATAAFAAPSTADILSANRSATGGDAWNGKATLSETYAYAGQGLTGKTDQTTDLKTGHYVQSYALGPLTGASGFDGDKAWAKDQSGTVTVQNGGDQRASAINEGYRDANLWWRPDHAGAKIDNLGTKSDGGKSYDVLKVTPAGGKSFEAWFDADSHLLVRIKEEQGAQLFTTELSDYRTVDGVKLAGKTLTTNGDHKYDQTVTLKTAEFEAAKPDGFYAPPKTKVHDFSIAGGTSTSFPFDLINNHIYADATVNGHGPYSFIFDTGGVNLLTPPLVEKLGLKSKGAMQANGAGTGHMEAGFTKVASLKLGKAEIKDQVFMTLPLNTMADIEGRPLPGMVGYETFRRFVTRIDYGTHRMTLIDPKAFDAKEAGTGMPIAFNGNTIEVNATFDGVKGNFTIDTGSRASLTLSAPFVAAHDLRAKSGKGIEAVSGWGIGGPSRAYVTRGDTLVLDGYTIKGPVVEMATDKGGAFADKATAGNIGAGILKRYIVTLDYNHSMLYLKPVTTKVSDLDTFDRSGLWINATDGGFKVVAVTKGAPGEKAGIQEGDIITAVDGKPASAIKLWKLRERLRNEAPGTQVTFTIKRGDKTETRTVTLEKLI